MARQSCHDWLVWYHGYMKPMTVRFPDKVHEHLRRAAFEQHISMNDLVCEGVEMRLSMKPRSATEKAVWAAWNALGENEPSPVKRIARELGMNTADVAFVVYPAETFGRWDDSQEPDLPAGEGGKR